MQTKATTTARKGHSVNHTKIFRAHQAFSIFSHLAKYTVIATTVFLSFFVILFSLPGDSKFIMEGLGHIMPIGVIGYGASVALFIVGNLIKESFVIRYYRRQIVNIETIFFIPSVKRTINFNEIEVLTLSSDVIDAQHGYTFIPTICMFLKDGSEISLTSRVFHIYPHYIPKINTEIEILAREIDCKFFPGIYGHKVARTVMGNVTFYQHIPHTEDIENPELEKSPIHRLENL